MRLQYLAIATGLVLMAGETGALAQAPQIFDGQSIRCKRPVGEEHRAICGTPDLLSLDKTEVAEYLRVTELYRTTDLTKFEDTINEQNGWINQRSSCRAKIECLRSSYRARIKQLQGIQTEAK